MTFGVIRSHGQRQFTFKYFDDGSGMARIMELTDNKYGFRLMNTIAHYFNTEAISGTSTDSDDDYTFGSGLGFQFYINDIN